MKKILITLTLATLITACGGSDSAKAIEEPTTSPVVITPPDTGETQSEIEIRLNLPAEPDFELNHSTLLGIDTDGDGIRDDLKRLVGFEFPNDEYARKVYERRAYLWTMLVQNDGDDDKQREIIYENFLNIGCKVRNYVPTTPKIGKFSNRIKTGFERHIYMSGLLNNLYGISGPNPSKEEVKNYCETFK